MSAGRRSAVSPTGAVAQEPIGSGLLLVAVLRPHLLPYVRPLIEFEARTEGSVGHLPMPSLANVHALHSGSKRKLSAVTGLTRWENAPDSAAQFSVDVVGRKDNFDWCSDEGQAVAIPMIDSGQYSCITMAQPCRLPVTTDMAQAFERYAAAGERSGVLVIVFVVCTMGHANSKLHEFADEYIEVDACEPDPDSDSVVTFSVEVPALADGRALGIDKSMYDIYLSDGRWTATETPFTSSSARDRAVGELAKSCKSLQAIADKLGVSTATVSRTIKKLREMKNGVPLPD
ncbi:helix-turn-helix domain-containing protein [Paraburkholderia sp. BL6665CI2N2]|uniref:helix-turn-helix domain-containing protein n=1 Tax=Paraburkholderia sp. BL6665CI2N2 TaxID=1938806 RepID=UPI001416FE65|nr:helix-turn-helix domain-containing protein [Paraburkholderia sp. BL6665CI2N2]